MPHAKNIRKPNEVVSHHRDFFDPFDVCERFIRVGCEGTTLDYDLFTGGRERPKRGKTLPRAVRLA
jgi:hypothetical protein